MHATNPRNAACPNSFDPKRTTHIPWINRKTYFEVLSIENKVARMPSAPTADIDEDEAVCNNLTAEQVGEGYIEELVEPADEDGSVTVGT